MARLYYEAVWWRVLNISGVLLERERRTAENVCYKVKGAGGKRSIIASRLGRLDRIWRGLQASCCLFGEASVVFVALRGLVLGSRGAAVCCFQLSFWNSARGASLCAGADARVFYCQEAVLCVRFPEFFCYNKG